MDRHYTKVDFHGISFMVIAFEVLSAMALLFSCVGALYIMFNNVTDVWTFVFVSFSGIVLAFVLYAIAEFLQLLMKIEVNTREIEKDVEALKPKKKTTRRKSTKK